MKKIIFILLIMITISVFAKDTSTPSLLHKSTPIWSVVNTDYALQKSAINFQKMVQLSGFRGITFSNFLVLGFLMLADILFSWFVISLCAQWVRKHEGSELLVVPLVKTIQLFICPLLLLSTTSIFLYTSFIGQTPNPFLESMSHSFLLYVISLAAIYFLFYSKAKDNSLLHLPRSLSNKCFYRFTIVATVGLVTYFLALLSEGQPITAMLLELIRTGLITLISFLVVWLCWLVNETPLVTSAKKYVSVFLKFILSFMLLAMITMEWLGFHEFAIFLLSSLFETVLLIIATTVVFRLFGRFFSIINNGISPISSWFHRVVGLSIHKSIYEITLVKYVAYLCIMLAFIMTFLCVWGVPETYVKGLQNSVISGFSISKMYVSPLRYVIAILIFCLLNIIARAVSTYVARQERVDVDDDAQVAVASIMYYVGFSISVVTALLIAGFNFTGIAIIAGALSVGIGLGLQGIVNNFISGIILLIEKPIEPGDRILIGDKEGIVKRIRMRATQITTLTKEDIIVPNSDLITLQVTNFMFQNRHWRVCCPVGVAYGSDIELVKETLLGVAKNHPDVFQTPKDGPMVLFKSFGDSSLMFELWCVIDDVNKKYLIASDLHFAVDTAFREKGIVIAFPQRDVHIKK